jgi:hypothetical protein
MIKIKAALTIIALTSVALTNIVSAAGEKTYTASGKVTRVVATEFTLRTPIQDIVIARDANTKVAGGDLKKGQGATVIYTKTAGRPIATQITMTGSAVK